MRGGRSRNKVAVGEPAAGSPPIFILFFLILILFSYFSQKNFELSEKPIDLFFV